MKQKENVKEEVKEEAGEKQQKNNFAQGSIVVNILKLAVPMTLAQLINVLYNIVDRLYIGQLKDEATISLTGLGLCLPIISIVIAFANLFGMGGAPLCSIERGRGNNEEAEAIMGNSFAMMVVVGVILTVVGLVFKRPMLYLFGASDATIGYADSYITIYLMGNIFVMTGLGMNSFINSQGFGTIGMMTVLLGAVANIILDPVFIFFFHMGVRGAALATILSQLISAIWILKFLTGPKAILKLKKNCMKLKRSRVLRIIGLGMSGFTMSITNSSVQVMYNAMLQKTGGDLYVGIMTVINTVREVISMPVQGKRIRPCEKSNCVCICCFCFVYIRSVVSGPCISGVFHPYLQPYRGSGGSGNSGYAYLFLRLFHDGVSVCRTGHLCWSWKSEKCGILLYFP